MTTSSEKSTAIGPRWIDSPITASDQFIGNNPLWVLAATARGGSHKASNRPNQDSFQIELRESHQAAAAAVADGHGSDAYFRSHLGSEFAASAFREYFHNVLVSVKTSQTPPPPASIVASWRSRVEIHRHDNPITHDEVLNLGDSQTKVFRHPEAQLLQIAPVLSYGSTLVGAVVLEDEATVVQLGDGDAILVLQDGRPRRLIADHGDLIGTETNSFAMRLASDHVKVLNFKFGPGMTIMLSTDGCFNSHPDEEAFLKVASDLHERAKTLSIGQTREDLRAYLNYVVQHGCGDDVSIILIHRPDWGSSDSSVTRQGPAPAGFLEVSSSRIEPSEDV